MLSKKYKAIKSLLKTVAKIRFIDRKLIVLTKMYLDIDKGFRFSYISDENGETNLLDALKHHYNKHPFIYFDVGAHVGTYTDMIIERFDAYHGHLFDLSKNTLDLCIKRHGNNKNLTINNFGLNSTIGQVEYRFYPKAQLQNGITGVGPYVGYEFHLQTADCVTGDHYCGIHQIDHIDLLKIDTEGYDLHVLKGFDHMLSSGNVDIIQFEYNIKSGETHSMLGDFYEYLENRGYIIGVLRQDGVHFKPFDFKQNDFNSGPNYVACLPKFKDTLLTFKNMLKG